MTTTVKPFGQGILSAGRTAGVIERGQKLALLEDIVAKSEIADRELIDRATSISELINLGTNPCKQIDDYNAVALRIWKLNVRFYIDLINAGADPESFDFPWHPPLFSAERPKTQKGLSFKACQLVPGQCLEMRVKSPCSNGIVDPNIRLWLHPEIKKQDLFNFAVDEGLGFAVPVVVWVVLAIATAGGIGFFTIKLLDSMSGAKEQKLRNEYVRELQEIGANRSRTLLECTKVLVEAGTNPSAAMSQCSAQVDQSLPLPAPPKAGIFDTIIGTTFKLGLIGLGGLLIYKKIQDL